MKDHTTEYARLVLSGKRLTGRTEKLACKRHIDDMHRKGFPYIFDVSEAEKHIKIANTLTIGEGTENGRLLHEDFRILLLVLSLAGVKKEVKNGDIVKPTYKWGDKMASHS